MIKEAFKYGFYKSLNRWNEFNTFVLYTLKTSEAVRFSNGFTGVEKGCIGNKWVNAAWNSRPRKVHEMFDSSMFLRLL